jgi:hypothetical protein
MKTFQQFITEADSVRAKILRTAANQIPTTSNKKLRDLKKTLLAAALKKYIEKNKQKSYTLADTGQGVTRAPK